MPDFDFDETESEIEGPVIQVPPRRPRQTLIQFLNLVAQTPSSNIKQETYSQYTKEKIKREKLSKAKTKCTRTYQAFY